MTGIHHREMAEGFAGSFLMRPRLDSVCRDNDRFKLQMASAEALHKMLACLACLSLSRARDGRRGSCGHATQGTSLGRPRELCATLALASVQPRYLAYAHKGAAGEPGYTTRHDPRAPTHFASRTFLIFATHLASCGDI